jgi:nucleoid-associated protein YgaU
MEAKTANRNSPDLSHMVEVRAGDTLPLLCHRIYNDSSYYPEVAKINKIINMQTLTPGNQTPFPPPEMIDA